MLKAVRRKGSKNYWTDGTVAGERVRQSLGTGDKAVADQLTAALALRLWKRHQFGDEAVRTFEEAALAYQEAGGEGRFLAPLLRHFKGRVLGSIKPGEVRTAAQKLYPGSSPATWNRQGIVPARAVIMHGHALGWCAAIGVESFEVRQARRVTVDRAWIDAFLAEADRRGLHHAAAAMLFMHQTATRIGATVRIMPEDADLRRRVVLIRTDKSQDNTERALTLELVIRIANLRPRARPIGDRTPRPLFGYASRFTLGQAIERICAGAKIAHVPSHQSGRHSAVSRAFDDRFTVPQVMDAFAIKSAELLLGTYAHAQGAGRQMADHLDRARSRRSRSAASKPSR